MGQLQVTLLIIVNNDIASRKKQGKNRASFHRAEKVTNYSDEYSGIDSIIRTLPPVIYFM